MNESAITLQVPKRRIYDVVGVLEGCGLLEKKSKNTVAWKGSEVLLGSSIDKHAKGQLERIRMEIIQSHKEEANLDQWIAVLVKVHSHQPVRTSDIIQAIFYPVGTEDSPLPETLVDGNGKPTRALLAVHAPFDSIVDIPPASEGPERQLYIGTQAGFLKHGGLLDVDSSGRKRKGPLVLHSRKGVKLPRTEDKMQVFLMPSYFDATSQKIKSLGTRQLSEGPDTPISAGVNTAVESGIANKTEPDISMIPKRSASWDAAESLANEEGVADFFGAESI
jgi:E2F/DP family winged-helix DNA-binding domain